MKKYLVLSLLFTSLTACATAPTGFGPAYGTDFGYRSTKLQSDRIRVSYTSQDAYEARDFALLRAAQLADIEGYSHFKIVNGGTFSNGPNAIGSNLAIGIGSGFRGGTRVNTQLGLGVHDVARALEGDKVTETLEVILMHGGTKTDPNVFDAKDVMKTIQPPVYKQTVQP